MRGLTDTERTVLSRCSGNPCDRYATPAEEEIIWRLFDQGRVGIRVVGEFLVPYVTPLGREAERLDSAARWRM